MNMYLTITSPYDLHFSEPGSFTDVLVYIVVEELKES